MTVRICAPAMRFAIAAVFVTGLALTAAQHATARPKIQSNGCTAAQIQSPQAKACIDQLNKDVLAGVRYVHALFCDAGGMSCCQTDGTRTFNCQSVGLVRGAGSLGPTPAGSLQPPSAPCQGPRCLVPPSGGLLESGPGFGPQGPAPTGGNRGTRGSGGGTGTLY
jgi:hypothetical protein